MSVAICPGSFDPVTMGHLDVIKRASAVFDTIIVAVAAQPRADGLFGLEQRVAFIQKACKDIPGVKVEPLDSLVVELAEARGARFIIKGLRAISDFEHEFMMAQFNRKFWPEAETIFMMASPEYMFLSSSAVKEIAQYHGPLAGLVPPQVQEELEKVYR